MARFTSRRLSVLTTFAAFTIAGCAGRSRSGDQLVAAAPTSSCAGRATMTVLNHTQELVGVHEVGGRRQLSLGEVAPGGVLEVPGAKAETRYGARGVRGTNTGWVAMTDTPRTQTGAGVSLVRGCDTR